MITNLELKNYVLSHPKLVVKKENASLPGTYILKYTRKTFYDNAWNQYLELCRGLIVDDEFNVITRPFTKIYNYGIEDNAPKLSDDTEIVAYRKINGFMCSMTWYNDNLLISTTGSTSSPFIDLVRDSYPFKGNEAYWKMIVEKYKGNTLLFECVHEQDPHIVIETPGLYFIGMSKNDINEKVDGFSNRFAWEEIGRELGTLPVEVVHSTIEEIKRWTKSCKHEGYVFYTEDYISSKIKSPYYLVNKLLARNVDLSKLFSNIKNKINVDEEYYPLVDYVKANRSRFETMVEQERLEFMREFLERDNYQVVA